MRSFTDIIRRPSVKGVIAAAVTVVVGIVGYYAISQSQAAGPWASLEPENAALAGNASVINDANASGGKAISFNAPSATPPAPGPTPTPPPANAGDYPNAHLDRCPNTSNVRSGPNGNTFAGGTFDGGGRTLSGSFSVGSDACVQNFRFNGGRLAIQDGARNVIIVNNTFQNWPGPQAISNINGSNITINFNTIGSMPAGGGRATAMFGNKYVEDLTINHNDIGELYNIDGIQIQFSRFQPDRGASKRVQISYNRITRNHRYPIELQDIVQGLKVKYNNVSTFNNGAGDGIGNQVHGQLSIAVGNQLDSQVCRSAPQLRCGLRPYREDTRNVEVAYNIVRALDSTSHACVESRGFAFDVHDNYCYDYDWGSNYAFTRSPTEAPTWYFRNNTMIGPRNRGNQWTYKQPWDTGPNHPPQDSGNRWFPKNQAPPAPAWNYRAGAQHTP